MRPQTPARGRLPARANRAGWIEIHSAAGRLVHRAALPVTTGPGEVAWDCRDDAGTPVPGGVYFVTLRTGEDVAIARKLVIVR